MLGGNKIVCTEGGVLDWRETDEYIGPWWQILNITVQQLDVDNLLYDVTGKSANSLKRKMLIKYLMSFSIRTGICS